MKFTYLLLLAVVGLLTFSCNKNKDEENPTPALSIISAAQNHPDSIPIGTTLNLSSSIGNGNSYAWKVNGIDYSTEQATSLALDTMGNYKVDLIINSGTESAAAISTTFKTVYSNGLVVLNQGTLSGRHGSIDFYSETNGKLYENIYEKANGYPFNVAASSTDAAAVYSSLQHNGKTYIIVAGGASETNHRIEVVNSNTFKAEGAISGVTNAVRHAAVTNGKLYITDWGAYDANYQNPNPKIFIADLTSNRIIKSLSLGFDMRVEGIIAYSNKIYVAHKGNTFQKTLGRHILILNTSTDAVEDSIAVPSYPKQMVVDKDGNIWVTCQDSIAVISPSSKSVIKQFKAPEALSGPIQTNKDKSVIWFLANYGASLYKVESNSTTPTKLDAKSSYSAIGYAPSSDKFILADPEGWGANKGKIAIYNSSGVWEKEMISTTTPIYFNNQRKAVK